MKSNRRAGGFLSVGKLTARVEKKDRRRNGEAEYCLNPSSSFIIHPSSFVAVRTPTAIVTDLGTEFGVEVDQSGVTESHVFVGKVKVLALAARNGSKGQEVSLGENESVRVEKSADAAASPVVIRRGVARPEGFVRAGQLARLMEQSKLTPLRRWLAYSRQLRKDPSLLAYYPFESVGKDSWMLANATAAGDSLDGQIEGPLWTTGRFPGKVALRFRGPGTGDKVVLPHQERFKFTGPFSLAVWFKVEQFTDKYQALITKADVLVATPAGRRHEHACLRHEPEGGKFAARAHSSGRTDVADGRWHLAVAVYEPDGNVARKRLYLDGRLDAEGQTPMPLSATTSRCGSEQ